MNKDSTFKEHFSIKAFQKIKPSEMRKKLDELGLSISEFYNPDLMFYNENKKELIICEHSSTGDRKPHIAELIQFIDFVKSNITSGLYFSYCLILDTKDQPQTDSPPNVDDEQKKLSYYYKSFTTLKIDSAIHNILVLDLQQEYYEKTVSLSVIINAANPVKPSK